jgi:hypothetical protein
MRGWRQSGANLELVSEKRRIEGLHNSGSDLDRKFWIALGLYGVLAVLVWFTMDPGKVLVLGRPVELRLIPILIIGTFALRTVVARHADRIRREGEKGGS